MPRPFTQQERATIEAALLEHGRRLFATQGLRKTAVEELTTAVGISKGAFYRFFGSKEELFFTLLEQFEARIKADLLDTIARPDLPPHQRMRALLEQALGVLRSEPLFTRLGRSEFEQLLRALPPARVADHLQGDDTFAEVFVAAWAAQGVHLSLPPPVVSGLIRSLFFVSIHEEDFAGGTYERVMTELITMLAERLLRREQADDQRA